MIVYACEKCKYTDLIEDGESRICPRCGGNMISLGVDSAKWNTLGIEQIYDLVNEKTGITEQEAETDARKPVVPDPVFYSAHEHSEQGYISYQSSNTKPRRKGNTLIAWIIAGAAILLCVGTAVFFYLREKTAVGDPDEQSQEITLSDTDAPIPEPDPEQEYPVYKFENCLYYDSMGEREKEIYQIFYDLVMHKDEDDYTRSVTMPLFEFDAINDSLYGIFNAMLADHPEFFYISASDTRNPSIEGYTDKVAAVIEFKLGPGSADENEMITKFDSAVNNFMRGIDKTAPVDQIELQIHDKLNDLVTYDRELLELGLGGPDLAHTAYGALVDNGRGKRHRAVCDGYACAYQYLLGKVGIRAAQVTGTAKKAQGETLWGDAYHAWSIVELDGEWYEVDCCWDDLELEELRDFYLEKEIKKVEDKYFYVTHHWFNRTTEEMANLPASERTRFFIPGYESFNFIEETSHVRQIRPEEDWYELYKYLDSFLPQATGTKYAL